MYKYENLRLFLFVLVALFVVNISLCGSEFFTPIKPTEIEMKLFKLGKIAFSYIEHIDLYCSDKGDNIILDVHNFHVHVRLYSHQK